MCPKKTLHPNLLKRGFTEYLQLKKESTSKTREEKTSVLPTLIFIARFLQHVPPKRFRRVRTYGSQSPAAKKK